MKIWQQPPQKQQQQQQKTKQHKTATELSIGTSIFFNFVNLCQIFCEELYLNRNLELAFSSDFKNK